MIRSHSATLANWRRGGGTIGGSANDDDDGGGGGVQRSVQCVQWDHELSPQEWGARDGKIWRDM